MIYLHVKMQQECSVRSLLETEINKGSANVFKGFESQRKLYG